MKRIRPYIGAAIGGTLFLFGVLGAIDILSVVTGHVGLFAGHWQRYPSWGVTALMIFVAIAGRWIDARESKVSAFRVAKSVIDRARRQ